MPATAKLDELFPYPHPTTLSRLSPKIWPGSTPQSTETAREILKDNYEKWHVFFLKDYRAHNHTVQCMLALWALGADEEIIREAYRLDVKLQIPKYPSPSKITANNFNDHLGDQDYYDAYLAYFSEVVNTKGVVATLEEYIFDINANFISRKKEGKQPEMLNRAMDAIIHSVIQFGYGLEFGLPGLVAEGCAWTAVHLASSSKVMPSSIWNVAATTKNAPSSISIVESLAQTFLGLGKKLFSAPSASAAGNNTSRNEASAKPNMHALSIIARMLKDPELGKVEPSDIYVTVYSNTVDRHGKTIAQYVSEWTYDSSALGEAERKTEELVWAMTVIYACGGWGKGNYEFNADFFYVHFVTSSIFLPSVVAVLTPASQEVFLRSYFTVCLSWWIGRGRADFDIPTFYAGTSTFQASSLSVPITASPPHKDAIPNPTSYKAYIPNPWLSLVRDALTLPDYHIPKTIRALAHWGEVLGRTRPGSFSQNIDKRAEMIELDGAENLDGTLFLRAAVLTMERADKDRGVNLSDTNYWDRKGFYEPGAPRGQFILPRSH